MRKFPASVTVFILFVLPWQLESASRTKRHYRYESESGEEDYNNSMDDDNYEESYELNNEGEEEGDYTDGTGTPSHGRQHGRYFGQSQSPPANNGALSNGNPYRPPGQTYSSQQAIGNSGYPSGSEYPYRPPGTGIPLQQSPGNKYSGAYPSGPKIGAFSQPGNNGYSGPPPGSFGYSVTPYQPPPQRNGYPDRLSQPPPGNNPYNKVGTVVANSKADLGQAISNAGSMRGGNVLANAVNGTRAVANAITNFGGDSQANAKTWGSGGAKSTAIAKGTGTALGNSESNGIGSAKSTAIAKSGNAQSNAIARGGGNALAKSVTSFGGNSMANSFATFGGNAQSDSTSINGDAVSNAIVD